MYSRWRHPSKTVSPRPYYRSRRGRNRLGSETIVPQRLPRQNARFNALPTKTLMCFTCGEDGSTQHQKLSESTSRGYNVGISQYQLKNIGKQYYYSNDRL